MVEGREVELNKDLMVGEGGREGKGSPGGGGLEGFPWLRRADARQDLGCQWSSPKQTLERQGTVVGGMG